MTAGSAAAQRGAKPQPTPAATPLSLTIDSPANEQTITGNQPVTVHLSVSPDLKPSQAITWYLNGSPLTNQAPDATQFTLDDLSRGTYTLGATVLDQATGESKSAAAGDLLCDAHVAAVPARTKVRSKQRRPCRQPGRLFGG